MTTPAPLRRRDATANREAILRAAQAVLGSDPTAPLDAIAQAAGLTRRALYGHFADRDALLRAVISLGAERFNEIAADTDDRDPRVALARLASRLWREAGVVRAAANLALDDQHVFDTMHALTPVRERVRTLTELGVRAGVFRRDIAVGALSQLIEETARTALRSRSVEPPDGEAVIVRVVLSIAGLSWVDQVTLLEEHPEILGRAEAHETPQ